MENRVLGPLGSTSALTLGGAGIAGCWGPTSTDEALATIEAAVDAGISLLDVAPSYETSQAPREAERLVGAAFNGRPPSGVRVLTKVSVEDADPEAIRATIRESLEQSLQTMRLDRVDILVHHAYLRPPRMPYLPPTLSYDLYRRVLRPEFEALREEKLIGAWGLTATGHPEAVFSALGEEPLPQVVQSVTNLLDSPGSLWNFGEAEQPDNSGTRRRASEAGIGVMGIRAVQAGALTDALDRTLPPDDPDRHDFDRAGGLRALATRRGESAAFLAYRYALSMESVDTVVIGVKNREELAECVAAEAAGRLSPDEMQEVERSAGRSV